MPNAFLAFIETLSKKGIFTTEAMLFIAIWYFTFEEFKTSQSQAVQMSLILSGIVGATTYMVVRSFTKTPKRKQVE